MCNAGGVDDVTWGALTLTLTLVGGLWTWFAFRNRGVASGLRGAGLTLLPAAAWLTGTMEMFTEIGGSVADWATHLALSPTVWVGIVLAGGSALLLFLSSVLRARGLGGGTASGQARPAAVDGSRRARPAVGPAPEKRGKPAIDDDLADIEALLRKRGIT